MASSAAGSPVIAVTDGSACGGHDARGDGRVGSLMRHFLAASAVPGLAGGMPKSAGTALLIAAAGALERDPPRVPRTGARAVSVAAVADPAQEEKLPTVRSDADDQSQRIHALPRSGRGGWTTTRRCAKKGAANRALPSVGFSQRVRGGQTPDPHPSAPSAGPIYLNCHPSDNPLLLPVANIRAS